MIFKIGALQKLMEQAYKSGYLIIGRDEYREQGRMGYYISNNLTWTVWNDEKLIPNSLKAAIVNYLGDLPEYGEEYEVGKDKKGQKQKRIQSDLYRLPMRLARQGARWSTTPIHIDRGSADFTVLQDENSLEDGINCAEIKTALLDMIKPDEVLEGEGEVFVGGPFMTSSGSGAMWASNVCYVLIATHIGEADEKLLRHFSKININEKE